MDITIGRIVLFTLDERDAEEINRRRTSGSSISERIQKNVPGGVSAWPIGAQAHIGNTVYVGDVYPMVVTRVWSPGNVNGQVLLDGNDCLWVSSVVEGARAHTWSWSVIK